MSLENEIVKLHKSLISLEEAINVLTKKFGENKAQVPALADLPNLESVTKKAAAEAVKEMEVAPAPPVPPAPLIDFAQATLIGKTLSDVANKRGGEIVMALLAKFNINKITELTVGNVEAFKKEMEDL